MSNAIYANARAKAKESSLLGLSRLNRMIDSLSGEEALKILSEVGFGGNTQIDGGDFETLISGELDSLRTFILECAPTEDVKKYLLIENDYKNAEAFIKQKHLKIDSSPMLGADGIYTKEFLKDKIFTDDYKAFDKEFAFALISADELFVSGSYDGLKVGGIFEKGKFASLREYSKKNKTLLEMFKVKVDVSNITICLRARDYSSIKDYLISGGTLTDSELKSLCEDSFDALKEKFSIGNRKEFIISAIEGAEKNKPLSEFEKKAGDFSLTYLMKYKYSFEGFYPFILYVYYKLAEISNVRLIMVGLNNGFSADDIKKRLKVSYAG